MASTLIDYVIVFNYILSHVYKTVSPQINNWKFSQVCLCLKVSRDVLGKNIVPLAWINVSLFEADFLWAFIWLNYAHHNAHFCNQLFTSALTYSS